MDHVIAGLSHVSIAVPKLEPAIETLRKNFGLTAGVIETNAAQGVRLVFFDLGNAKIELIEPTDPSSPLAKFIERNPRGGIHHFALTTLNFDGAAAELAANGVTMSGGKDQRNVHGEPITFIHPKDFLGALVELEGH
jgi:methylmalonyl-CoA/ethylmalonyl-CoA epimerase